MPKQLTQHHIVRQTLVRNLRIPTIFPSEIAKLLCWMAFTFTPPQISYEVCPKIFLLLAIAHPSVVIFQQNLIQKHYLIPYSQVPKKQASIVYRKNNLEEIKFL